MTKSRRSKSKYPALDPTLNLKTRYELIADCDYLDKLSDKEKEWLNNFNEEYINANMNHKGKKLHKSKKQKKDCYDRNNSRNRCLLTIKRATGMCTDLEEAKVENKTLENTEDFLIKVIDEKKK